MNESPKDGDKGKESDFSEFARARDSQSGSPGASGNSGGSSGSFLRGCGIALGIAFLLFAFVVGACFMSI